MRCVARRKRRNELCVGELSSKSGSCAERRDPVVLTPYDQRRGIYRSVGGYDFLNMRWDDELSCFDQCRFRTLLFKGLCILRDCFLRYFGSIVVDDVEY